MIRLLLVFFTFNLFANDYTEYVNLLSGSLKLYENDLYVSAPEPLTITRSYSSGNTLQPEAGWQILPHLKLRLFVHLEGNRTSNERAFVSEHDGTTLLYLTPQKGNKELYKPDLTEDLLSLTNLPQGTSFNANLENAYFTRSNKTIYFHHPDGTLRTYEEYEVFEDSIFNLEDLTKYSNNEHLFHLKSEKKPNGNLIIYNYDNKGRISKIESKNPTGKKTYAWVNFKHKSNKDSASCHVSSSDGREVTYNYSVKTIDNFHSSKERKELGEEKKISYHFLESIDSNFGLNKSFHYSKERERKIPFVKEEHDHNNPTFKASYYHLDENIVIKEKVHVKGYSDTKLNRIKSIKFPSSSKECSPTHFFLYNIGKKKVPSPGITLVKDIYGGETSYHFSKIGRIQFIKSRENGKLLQETRYEWGANNKPHLLKSLIIKDQNDSKKTSYSYDTFGNVTQVEVSGKSKKESSSIHRKYSQDGLNRLLSQVETNGVETSYTYFKDTQLITSKLTHFQNRILVREFYEYNQDHILVRMITDDGSTKDSDNLKGVSIRKITLIKPKNSTPGLGFPEEIEERYFDQTREKLLNKKVYSYNKQNLISKIDFYDADHTYVYSNRFFYDKAGNLIKKVDEQNRDAIYSYNKKNQLISEKEANSPITRLYSYDHASNVIQIELTSKDGNRKSSYTYDKLKNKTSSTSFQGRTTQFEHDALGRMTSSTTPQNLHLPSITTHFSYDPFGNVINLKNQEGKSKHIEYTSFNKPKAVIDEKGNRINKIYAKDGSLQKEVHPDGTTIQYQTDYFGRTTSKKLISANGTLFSSESWEYNAFSLLSYTDSTGIQTLYHYDGAGRKICEETRSSLGTKKAKFSYDSMGRIYSVKTEHSGSTIENKTLYDISGNVLEQWKEENGRKIFDHSYYEYDHYGRRIVKSDVTYSGRATDIISYDSFGRIVEHIDAMDRKTLFSYDDFHPLSGGERATKKTIIDSLGNLTIEITNQQNKILSLEKKNPLEMTLSKEKYFYDEQGNKTLQINFIYYLQKCISKSKTRWVYKDGQLEFLTLNYQGPSEKTTRYAYDSQGRKTSEMKPDGTIIACAYDTAGRLTRLNSSDGEIDYSYTYNAKGFLTDACDNINNTSTTRQFNDLGHMIFERQDHNLSLSKTYDHLGRLLTITLPDQSSISYEHDALYLRQINRLSAEGELLYSHNYSTYDAQGNLLEQEMIANTGSFETKRDLTGKITHQRSPYHTSNYTYNETGHLCSHNSSHFGTTEVSYDGLDQIIQDRGPITHMYRYDSLHNRRELDHVPSEFNDLNQLISSQTEQYSYDLNGNPIQKITPKSKTDYHYDALSRLTKVVTKTHTILFHYDALNRRTQKRIYTNHITHPRLVSHQNFLYQDEMEIASISDGSIKQLRILGISQGADIGAAVAIELNDEVYAPLHDHRGNITHLIHADTRELAEAYYYSSFGEEQIYNGKGRPIPYTTIRNPWRYASKRVDDETGLIFYGKRYYNPSTGRWLTPDPAGLIDGVNLYAYVHANPQSFSDKEGLFVVESLITIGVLAGSWISEKYFNVRLPTSHLFIGAGFDFGPDPLKSNSTMLLPRFDFSFHNELLGNIYVGLNSARKPKGILNLNPDSSMGQSGDKGALSDNLKFTFINGVYNTYTSCHTSATILSDIIDGYEVNFVYNATLGILGDIAECITGLVMHTLSDPATLLMYDWIDHYKKTSGGGHVIHTCHSQGAIHTRNALETLSRYHPEVARSIHVLAVGPAAYIDPDTCGFVTHYVATTDPVTWADPAGRQKYSDTIQLVNTKGQGIVHSFLHPSYQSELKTGIKQRIKTLGYQ